MDNNALTNLYQNDDLSTLTNLIETIMELPEDGLTELTIESLQGMITGALPPRIFNESVINTIKNFEDEGLTRVKAQTVVNSTKQALTQYLDELNPSEKKRALLDTVFNIIYDVFDQAIEKYHNYHINLPIMLEQGAKVPTYAYDTDAAADLYAADTVTLPAHSTSNMIRTGVHIGLPEGWMAIILPRSSIGAKTGLRLSNSAGVIDSSYRGQLGVLYDNISDSEYTIHAGDRIAQLLVMPSYRFKATVVEALDETDRGEGGFGSTGV